MIRATLVGTIAAALAAMAGCGVVGGNDEVADAAVEAPAIDATVDAAAPPPDGGPGSKDRPGKDCAQLRVLVGPTSGVYWLEHPDGHSPPFEVYCEQQINDGGWALLENSVLTEGKTTAFWQFTHPQRFDRMGTPAPDQNYYQGALYLIGTRYMDVIVDLQDKAVIAAVMTTTGIDANSMHFADAKLEIGNQTIFNDQFAAGWSSKDLDIDPHVKNCATVYNNVAQHYSSCWSYNLGSDADEPTLDGGVGPHVNNGILTILGLSLQPDGGAYSRVKRIARFTRW